MVAGQSNAVGEGDQRFSYTCLSNTAFEYKSSTNEFTFLKDPVGEGGYGFDVAQTGSSWPAFAKRLYELSSQTIYIVPAAKGGSTLNPSGFEHLRWDYEGNLWTSAVEKINLASAKIGLPLSGIIWSQGEADASAINAHELTPQQYKVQLKKMISRFRDEFSPELPFYIIQTGFAAGEDSRGYEAVQKIQEEICNELPHTYLVYTFTRYFKEYNLMIDYIHYNQQGYNAIGKTIAEVIYNIEEKKEFNRPIYANAIFPNPSNSTFNIPFFNVALEENATIKVLSSIGGTPIKHFSLPLRQEIFETVTIELDDLREGLYLLQFQLGAYNKVEKINVKH